MWSFYNPVKINFGRGIRKKILTELESNNCLIVTSKRGNHQFRSDEILSKFEEKINTTWLDTVSESPTILDIQQHIDSLEGNDFDTILAFGGGSVIDTAKALAVSLKDINSNLNIKKLLQKKVELAPKKPIPLYAFPTTSGTGSEVTSFATIWDHIEKKKYSLDGESIYPYSAFIDSELTDGLPLEITLSTGLDAINQASESIWNKRASGFTIDLAIKALKLGFSSLPLLIEKNENAKLRNNMSECSLLAGLAISQTRTAVCHSISYPLTAHFGVPHGLACAFTMVEVLKINLKKDDGRFVKVAKNLIGDKYSPFDLPVFFEDLCSRLKVAGRIRSYIPNIELMKNLTGEMYTKERIKNNLAPILSSQMNSILEKSYNK